VHHPEGRVSGDSTGRLFRGSGTSQAAAVTSGAAALLLQAHPRLSPDQVKAALVGSAVKMSGTDLDRGAGHLDVAAASKAAGKLLKKSTAATQSFPAATGSGSLEAARGGSNLVDAATGMMLRGEIDVQSRPWNGRAWWAAASTETAWSGGEWNGARWSGSNWSGGAWSSMGWDGARWSGGLWADLAWTGARWSGARWSGKHWSGQGWQ
jgi:serine protease AprX